MTFREVKVAEFEHFPVFFPDNRELWKKVFSGQALTEDGKIRAKKSAGSPARDQSRIWQVAGMGGPTAERTSYNSEREEPDSMNDCIEGNLRELRTKIA